MFEKYIVDKSPATYADKVLVVDDERLREKYNIAEEFEQRGHKAVEYSNDLDFRIDHETEIKTEGNKLAVFAESTQYIPYDLLCRMASYQISMSKLFPSIYAKIPGRERDLDLILNAYISSFVKNLNEKEVQSFFDNKVYSKENIEAYIEHLWSEIQRVVSESPDYEDWLYVADQKAEIDVLCSRFDIEKDTSVLNNQFKEYVLQEYGKLSSKIGKKAPTLVSGTMEYMHENSNKFVLIVMDGMSEFDWKVLSESFTGIKYQKASTMAMIPTTTSVSRQCLLSGKLPSQLIDPWKQANEKKEFISCAKELGYSEEEIGYERGYDAEFSSFIKCGAVVILDCDEMLHAQKQGKKGMYQNMKLLNESKKLTKLVERMLKAGFDVYIAADHGDTVCTGIGKVTGAGVEIETKSRRMLVLKDFADKESLKGKDRLIDYPKYYLPKEYDYMICDTGVSFDSKGDKVLSHGGITLDEVVVPFIKIKAVENNG